MSVGKSACTAAVVVLCAAAAWAGPSKPPTAKDQVAFGVKMASRGLWSEALFRFEQAARLDPNNADIFNNLAVASEALGMFEEALQYYRKALELEPTHKGVRGNYSRFVEFYQSFKPPEESGASEERTGQEPGPEGGGTGSTEGGPSGAGDRS